MPAARLTVQHGRAKSRLDIPRIPLRVKENRKFKVIQISDTHMVTSFMVCTDTIDAYGKPLLECQTGPLTISFLREILNTEKLACFGTQAFY
jgi:hypothetical protein